MKFKRFLTNTHNQKDVNAAMYVSSFFRETPEQYLQHQKEYLSDKVISTPHATKHYSVKQLEDMGMVGVYKMMGLVEFVKHVLLCMKIDLKMRFKIYPYSNLKFKSESLVTSEGKSE